MKRLTHFIMIFLAISSFFVIRALAAEQEVDKTQSIKAPTDQKAVTTLPQTQTNEKAAMDEADRVSTILGKKVISQEGEDLGNVEDIVLNKSGCLDYIVLVPEGLLGTGDRLIPVPWKAVKTSSQADTIIIDMNKSQLEQAPNFESRKWPKFTDSEWYEKMRAFFGGQK